MDPGHLIPTPDVLPAPWSLFNLLLVPTFTLHLLLANMMVGLGVILFFKAARRHSQPTLDQDSSFWAGKIPWIIALTVNLGVAPLLFLQVIQGQFLYVSSVLMASYYISILVLVILGYYGAYLMDMRQARLGRARVWIQAVSVFLFLIVSYFFTCSVVLMINPGQWHEYFQHPFGLLLPGGDYSLLPRYLHFVASSLAVGGLSMGVFGWWRAKRGRESEDMIRQGLLWYGVATMVNFGIGAWYLAALPQPVLDQVIASKASLVLLMVAVIAGLASVPAALGRQPLTAGWCALASIVFMVIFRYVVRGFYLAPYLKVDEMPVDTQYSAALLFFAALALGVVLVVYLIKLALKAGKEVRQ